MQNPSAPVVETRQGALTGLTDENVHRWCGIPYADRQWVTGAGAHRAHQNAGMAFAMPLPFRPQAGKAVNIVRSWAGAIPASSLKTVSI